MCKFWVLATCQVSCPNMAIGQNSRSCTCTLFLPHGMEIELIFALRAAVFEIWAYFQNCYIWAWNLEFEKSAGSCIWTSFYPRGSKLSLFQLYGQWFPRYGPFFKIAIFGYETWNLKKCRKLHNGAFYTLGDRNWAHFPVQAVVFEMEQFKVLI